MSYNGITADSRSAYAGSTPVMFTKLLRMNVRWKEVRTAQDDKEIKGFYGDYSWLCNFHECPIEYEGLSYPSSEAAYQSAKTEDMKERERFTKMTPGIAKIQGRALDIREDWEEVKDQVMLDILRDKFTRNQGLRQKLVDTEERYLEETNWWNDTYWGVCKEQGKNMLGKTLMQVRDEIKNNKI